VGRERRRRKGRNREYKDARAVAKALVVNELIVIFYARHGKS
jgi:hypothetical protein